MTPWSRLEQASSAVAAAKAAPLSRKAAMLAVLLLDAAVDARSGAGDVVAFRRAAGRDHEALGLVMALAAMRDLGPRLVVEPVPVPKADYPELAVEDYMVSLYNDRTVPRVLVALPDGGRRDAHALLAEALAALERL